MPVNVYLHGDTTTGGPLLPTILNYVATWGPAEVTLNGESFENPYDGPVAGHQTVAGLVDFGDMVYSYTVNHRR